MKKVLAVILALAMILAFAACGDKKTEEPAAEPAAEPKTVGYVTISGSAPWGALIGTTLEKICKDAGWDWKYLDAETNADKVNEHVQTLIDAGVDAIVVFGGVPAANSDNAKKASEAGIPMFMAGLDVSEEGRQYVAACVGPDQQQCFVEYADFVIEQEGGAEAGLKVAQISGVPFLDDYIMREAGFRSEMEAKSNYDISLETQYAFSSRADAKTFMEQYIQQYGEGINILMGYDDDLTMGAVQAIEEAGLTGKIHVYSFTGQNDAIQAVADGKMQCTIVNRAADIAEELKVAMDEYFETGKTEYYHYTPLTYVTSENVKEWIGKGEF